ncbi:MAG TPA: type VI secretion system-associated FHA domain protein [Anaeromyxobacter sp.]
MTPLVVRIEDLQTGTKTQFAFLKSPVRIGRSEINDLPLPQGFVSQWHAVVQFDDKEIRYVDLGSTNGSIVDGARVAKNAVVVLGSGAQVTIGALRLTFERRATGEHRAAPPRTQFAIRAATVMRSAVKPGTLPAGAGEPERAPAPPAAAAAPPMAGSAPDAAALAAIAEALATPLGDLPGAPPAPFPGPEPLPELAAAVVDQALENAALDLDLLYASYRGAWEHLRAHIEQTVAGMDPASRAAAARRLAEKYPATLQEPQFRDISGAAAPPAGAATPAAAPGRPAAPPPASGGSDAEQLLAAFAESYLPASAHVRAGAERQAFLGRVAEGLETFARSFVEMRKGYEEFGKQMGVRTVHGDGPVQRAKDPRQLLAALLDPAQPGRADELQAAFADYMVHQVAILNGVAEGAKAMLRGLSPESIEAKTQGMWPMKGQALWKAYEERFHAIFDEEDAISDALFGREFGRAYTAIVGQRGAGADGDGDAAPEEDEEDDRPRPAKARRR